MSSGERHLQLALVGMATSDMRRWMENNVTVARMLSYLQVVLKYGIRPTSKLFDALPDEILLMILYIAAHCNRGTRRALQAVCRRFRCLIVLDGSFFTDLTSFPPLPAVFMDHLVRAFSQTRPLRLVLDNANFLGNVPPPHCLLAAIPRCGVILIQHGITPLEAVLALAHAGENRFASDVRILSLSNQVAAPNSIPEWSAPSLRIFHIRHAYIDLVNTTKMVDFLVDCGHLRHPSPGPVRNAWPSSVLHATLARNPGLQSVDLREAVDDRWYPLQTDLGPVELPLLKHLSINSMLPQTSIWLLERMHFPPSAYLSVSVGRGESQPFSEASALARALSYKLQGRTFDHLLVVDDKRSTSVMFSNGGRVWEPTTLGDMESLSLGARGRYLPQPGAVDFTVYWSKRSVDEDPVRWYDVLCWFCKAGTSTSNIASFEMRSVFKDNSMSGKAVSRYLKGVGTLRLWPASTDDLKTLLWRLCSEDEIPWHVVGNVLADMFPGLRVVVDVAGKRVARGDSVADMLANVLLLLEAHYE